MGERKKIRKVEKKDLKNEKEKLRKKKGRKHSLQLNSP